MMIEPRRLKSQLGVGELGAGDLGVGEAAGAPPSVPQPPFPLQVFLSFSASAIVWRETPAWPEVLAA